MGKTATLSHWEIRIGEFANILRQTNIIIFMSGASYKVSKRWTTDALFHRKMDGIVNNQFITSLKKDGYHRLYREF